MRVDHQSPDDVPQNPSNAAIRLGISYGDGEAETPGKKKIKKIISSEPTDSAACNASRRREAAALGRDDASRREDGESVSRSTRRRNAKAPPLLNEPAGRLMARWRERGRG